MKLGQCLFTDRPRFDLPRFVNADADHLGQPEVLLLRPLQRVGVVRRVNGSLRVGLLHRQILHESKSNKGPMGSYLTRKNMLWDQYYKPNLAIIHLP